MNIKLDYSDVKFKDNGKLKLLIIVGTRPEIIRLAAVIKKCDKYCHIFVCILTIPRIPLTVLSSISDFKSIPAFNISLQSLHVFCQSITL